MTRKHAEKLLSKITDSSTTIIERPFAVSLWYNGGEGMWQWELVGWRTKNYFAGGTAIDQNVAIAVAAAAIERLTNAMPKQTSMSAEEVVKKIAAIIEEAQ